MGEYILVKTYDIVLNYQIQIDEMQFMVTEGTRLNRIHSLHYKTQYTWKQLHSI